jgi:hypothetical protein
MNISRIALAADGRWRSGCNFRSWGAFVASGASSKHWPTYATCQDAIEAQVAHAGRYFRIRLKDADDGRWSAAGVRKVPRSFEELTTPQQMEMFS